MKLFSSPKFLVVGALTLGLVACGAAPMTAGSNQNASPGPIGPAATTSATSTSTAELPPDVIDMKNDDKDEPKKLIIASSDNGVQDLAEDKDLDEDKLDRNDAVRARGPADPLAVPPPLSVAQGGPGGQGEGGGMFGGAPGGIASNPKGANQHRGGTGTGGTNIGAATEVRGTIDKAEIRRVVQMHVKDVKHCYVQGLARRPDLEGKVVLKFTIGKTGTVVAAMVQETTLNERQVEQCIASAAMRWIFPKPTGEGIVVISYPFILKSAG